MAALSFLPFHFGFLSTVSPSRPGVEQVDLSSLDFLPLVLVSISYFGTRVKIVTSTFFTKAVTRVGVIDTLEVAAPAVANRKVLILGRALLLSTTEPLSGVLFPATFGIVIVPDVPTPAPANVPVGPDVGPSGWASSHFYYLITPARTDVPGCLIHSYGRVPGTL